MISNKVSVIIVHWNTPDLLRNQLANLIHESIEIIVIDNNSSDKPRWIAGEYKTVTYIENRLNRGYAAACNQGAAVATGDWLLFLNPDVEMTFSQIDEMVKSATQAQFDACSPKPESTDYQKPVPTVWSLLQEFTPLHTLIHSPPFEGGVPRRGEVVIKSHTLTGGCLLIKSDILHKLGGWDERFFIWFEDSDLTKQLVDGNYKIGWLSTAVKHTGGVSFKTIDDQLKRDMFFCAMDVYAKKHFSTFGKFVVSLIKRRYTKRNVLPSLHQGISITIPNMKPAILQTFFADNEDFLKTVDELIIVTSGIDNTTIWEWRKKYHQVRFILLKDNEGFASTVNIGLRASTGAWIGTVNDDTILSHDWIQKCLECSSEDTGALNPVIYQPDGTIESAGIKILKKGKALQVQTIPADNKCYEVDAANAAAVLYKNAALNSAGIFDERFGSYLEDIDLSLRIKRNGYKNIVCAGSKVTHIGHATSATTIWKIKPWLDFRNWIYVILKNWSLPDLVFNSPGIIVERLHNISGIIKSK